jgi:riboflavin synthase
MFTGIVSDVGQTVEFSKLGARSRLAVASAYDPKSIALGASIANAGVCLTVVGVEPGAQGSRLTFDVGAETLAVTTLGGWREGERVNLERSLRVGDELGGHMVSGHVDGVAEILSRRDFDGMAHFRFRAPRDCAKFIAVKGSVALHVLDRQRRRRRCVRGFADPSYARGHHLGRTKSRRPGQS